MSTKIEDLKSVDKPTIDIVVVLDRSGSMQTNKSDHEGGLKAFVEEQKNKATENTKFTFVRFDTGDPFELVYDRVPFNKAVSIHLNPRGGTPLLDAVGKTIVHLEENGAKEVLMMIISDGLENSSKEWTAEGLKNKIKEMEEKNWNFNFLGTNMDAISVGENLGFKGSTSATYNSSADSIKTLYEMNSEKFSRYNACRNTGGDIKTSSIVLDYTDEEREELQK